MKESEIIALIKENDTETGMKILKKYGGERYMKGATNFAKLVRDMRYKQKQTPETAGDLEKQVDRAVDAVLGVK